MPSRVPHRRSVIDKVLSDSTISLPLMHPIRVRGRRLRDLQHEIDVAYSAAGPDVTVSLVPRSTWAGTELVLGEVAKPGKIDSDRPHNPTSGDGGSGTTVLQSTDDPRSDLYGLMVG